ncbi:MAG: NAD(P)H-dependent oxidoreductase subunit E [Acidobacteria bacterium]|nr:NAD(P)H-dependent oxidoreductase subunit E [Acidobacteriota bacterium]
MARLNPTNIERAREVIARYPQPRSAMIPLLHLAQEQDGHITDDAKAHIAELVGVMPAEVHGVSTFYEMFKHEDVGRYLVGVCTNLSCMLLGADELLAHAEDKLGVKVGGTTPDGSFTLEQMQCLAACGGAPCIQVNYRYFENVTPERFDGVIAALSAGTDPEGQAVPPHGTLSRVSLPHPSTDADRERPQEIHS